MTKINDFLLAVAVGLVTALVVFGVMWIPALGIMLVLLPVPFIYLALRREVWAGAVALLVFCLIYALLGGIMAGGTVLLLTVFLVLGIPLILKQQRPYMEILAFSAGFALVSLLSVMGAYTLLSGQTPFSALVAATEQFFTVNQASIAPNLEIYQRMGVLDPGLSYQGFIQLIVSSLRELSPVVPAVLITSAVIAGLLNLMIPYRLAARKGVNLPEIPPFGRWRMPRGTVLGFFIMGGLSLILMLINEAMAQPVLCTVSSLFFFLFSIQGLSVADYLMANSHLSGALRVILCLLLFVFLSTLLFFVGIFEQFLHIREQMEHMKNR